MLMSEVQIQEEYIAIMYYNVKCFECIYYYTRIHRCRPGLRLIPFGAMRFFVTRPYLSCLENVAGLLARHRRLPHKPKRRFTQAPCAFSICIYRFWRGDFPSTGSRTPLILLVYLSSSSRCSASCRTNRETANFVSLGS